jgi:hypothetical protein
MERPQNFFQLKTKRKVVDLAQRGLDIVKENLKKKDIKYRKIVVKRKAGKHSTGLYRVWLK